MRAYDAFRVNLVDSFIRSAMSNQIPPEIWLYISQFIPDDDLYRQLRTINSTFFHLAMALKYEEVFIIWSAASPTLPRMMVRLR
jgi:hypothetical protein